MGNLLDEFEQAVFGAGADTWFVKPYWLTSFPLLGSQLGRFCVSDSPIALLKMLLGGPLEML